MVCAPAALRPHGHHASAQAGSTQLMWRKHTNQPASGLVKLSHISLVWGNRKFSFKLINLLLILYELVLGSSRSLPLSYSIFSPDVSQARLLSSHHLGSCYACLILWLLLFSSQQRDFPSICACLPEIVKLVLPALCGECG